MSTDLPDLASPPTPDASSSVRPARRRRRFPGPWCLGIVVLALVALGLFRARILGAGMEQANINVASLALVLVAVGAVLVWFVLFSAYSLRQRGAVAVLLAVTLAAAVACLRIEQVSGDLVPRLVFRWQPDADQRLARPAAEAKSVDLQTTTPEDFPQFLGPRRDARLTGLRLRRDWLSHPPRLVWRQEIGAGWSTFAAVNGFAVTMEQRGDEELVTCYEIATGGLHWFHAVPARHQTVLGGAGPRGTPTIHEGRVYALGATGVLRCLDGATGRPVWIEDLLARIGVSAEEDLSAVAWGRAHSPLIVDDLVVVPLGGPARGPWVSLAAFDKATGRLVWTGGDCQASYSSPVLATIAGQRQILIVNQDAVSGHDPASGQPLWKHPWLGSSRGDANVSQAVPVSHDRVLLSKGYGGGAKLLQVSRAAGGRWQVSEIWSNSRVLRTKYCNVVVHDGHVYGLSDGILECVELASGRRVWKAGRYAQGQVLGVDDWLVVQAESGEVALVQATPAGHREGGRFAALDGKTWNNPSLYGRYLLVRNAEQAACYELAVEP
ncbi:MAG: PQQ-binding-like beta-propeller repeat protein [Candidatus Anammoximicrobium sp.]|nr:PQQ-binding-like beta-propeller repeat protein [Candidatus Anammoximicrobium sp.]